MIFISEVLMFSFFVDLVKHLLGGGGLQLCL